MKSEIIRRLLISGAAALLAVGGALLAVVSVKRDVSRLMPLTDDAYRAMLVVGIAFLVIAGVAFIAAFLVRPVVRLIEAIFSDNHRHICDYARPADIYVLHALYTEYFHGDVASQSLMRAWIQASPRALAMIYRINHRSPRKQEKELVGSFKVLMLNDEGAKGVEAGELSGATLGSEHIVRHAGDARGYYVGDVVATTWRARSVVLANLNIACKRAVREGKPIYARPLTPDGKRVMTKHGFVQVGNGQEPQTGKMCVLVATKMSHNSLERSKPRQRKNRRNALVPKTPKGFSVRS